MLLEIIKKETTFGATLLSNFWIQESSFFNNIINVIIEDGLKILKKKLQMKNWYSEILTGNHACTYSHVTDSYPGTVRYSQATILLGNHACSHSHITVTLVQWDTHR